MKKLFFVALILAAVGLATMFILEAPKSPQPSAWTILPDGTGVRILAATYGTNHVVGSKLAISIDRLPGSFQKFFKRLLGARAALRAKKITSTPALVVWLNFRSKSSPPTDRTHNLITHTIIPSVEVYLGNGSNFISGEKSYFFAGSFGASLQPVQFQSFPRRDSIIHFNIVGRDTKGGCYVYKTLAFENPVFRKYADWRPDTLPATKRSQRVQATLRTFETGYDKFGWSPKELPDGRMLALFCTNRFFSLDSASAVDVEIKSIQNTNEIWVAAGVELADSTGNRVGNYVGSEEYSRFSFAPSLWPDEPAWKFKLWAKRIRGLYPEDILVIKGIPLGETNRTNHLGWSTNFNSVTVNVESVCRRSPASNESYRCSQLAEIKFTLPAMPDGMVLDLLEAKYDIGKMKPPTISEAFADHRSYFFEDVPTNAQTVDCTFAVQKMEALEFSVRPEMPSTMLGANMRWP